LLSDDKEQRLLDVGFVFDTRTSSFRWMTHGRRRCKDDWDEMFQELQDYIKKHGNMDSLPRRYNPDQPLVGWVYRQRSQYRKLIGGEPSRLTEEKVAQLKSVDFNFSFKKNSFRALPGWMEGLMPEKKGESSKKAPKSSSTEADLDVHVTAEDKVAAAVDCVLNDKAAENDSSSTAENSGLSPVKEDVPVAPVADAKGDLAPTGQDDQIASLADPSPAKEDVPTAEVAADVLGDLAPADQDEPNRPSPAKEEVAVTLAADLKVPSLEKEEVTVAPNADPTDPSPAKEDVAVAPAAEGQGDLAPAGKNDPIPSISDPEVAENKLSEAFNGGAPPEMGAALCIVGDEPEESLEGVTVHEI
jgi:Helicase associated domain